METKLRPLGVGDLLDATFQIYRHHFTTLLAIAAVVVVPLALIQMAYYVALDTAPSPDTLAAGDVGEAIGMLVVAGGGGLLMVVIVVLAYLVMEGALAIAVSQIYLEGRTTVAHAYDVALPRLTSLLGMSAIGGLIMVGLSITIIGIPVVMWLAVRWAFAVQAVTLESRGAWASLKRSSELVRGSWWRVLGIVLLLFVLQSILSFIFGMVGGVAGFVWPAGSVVGIVVQRVVEAAATVLTMPLVWIGLTLLYYDQRVRKEGFDLEMLAEGTFRRSQPSPYDAGDPWRQ